MSKFKDIATDLIVTCFFTGRIKYAPGTFGSLLAFPINYILVLSVIKSRFLLPFNAISDFERELLTIIFCMFMMTVILFILGVIASNQYVKRTRREDPKEVVIDETVGQMLTSILTLPSFVFALQIYNNNISQSLIEVVTLFVLPFILFRIFDIIKPWPIGWVDRNVKGGIGIMLDDILAAFMASLMQYAIIFIFI